MNSIPHHDARTTDHGAVRSIVRETVVETLSNLGFDACHPNELQADMYFLRRLRRGGEENRGVMMKTMLTIAVTSALCLLWEALRARFVD